MSTKDLSADMFFAQSDLTLKEAQDIVTTGLKDADYGELYHEIVETEGLSKDSGAYTSISIGNSRAGFAIRIGQGERVGHSVSDTFNKAALKEAVAEAQKVLKTGVTPAEKPVSGMVETPLYSADNPMNSMSLEEKIAVIDAIESYAKAQDARVINVSLGYSAGFKAVHIITSDGKSLVDMRPMASLRISLTLKDTDGNVQTGYALLGGRTDCKEIFSENAYKDGVADALHIATELLRAEEAPAGEMDVVIANGWGAVLLHEAVGHGMEGDFISRSISVYSGQVGQKVAGDEVTVIDQGDLPGERGSQRFDDEGQPMRQNILIKDGILQGYMHDLASARKMGVEPTGNGRRQDYTCMPMPRMTNTLFANGKHTKEQIIESVKDGLYVSHLGGGQVDITSGDFNMVATLAYRIRDGKICEPVKGATLIGDGLHTIQSITMVGNDLKLEKAAGMCGKDGQSVVVGCGQPTIRISKMTVGGTKK